MSKTVTVILARMGSSRFPGKVVGEIAGRSVLERIIRNLKRSVFSDSIILATTTLEEDDLLAATAEKLGIAVHRGSDTDVLGRLRGAIDPVEAAAVVVAYGDNPLVSEEVVDLLISFREREALDLAFMPGLPLGADAIVFSRAAIETAAAEARLELEREHVNAFVVERPERFRVGRLAPPLHLNHPELRLTVDTEADLDLLCEVELELDRRNRPFVLDEVCALADDMPELFLANADVQQRYATESWRKSRSGEGAR
ncbi:MAG: NTP transferase domain-containing protein [Planctomycetes bacterium]|nr:NTP transferase domain-containing protein [Planctomycetota bacterium]